MVASGRVMVGNLGTQVAALLGRRIVAGDLTPGTTLPTEAELCESFNVSRTTIREALKKLHGKGLIAGTTPLGHPRAAHRTVEPVRLRPADLAA